MPSGLRVGVVGATGLVGRKLLEVLAERDFPVAELRPLAGTRSAGTPMTFRGNTLQVREAQPEALKGLDLVFMAAGTDVSRALAPGAAGGGAVVIDKSSAFRMEPQVPLVVPEVNGHTLKDHRGIVASPNCSTIQLVMALQPLHRQAGLRRVIVSTYQSVSGSGAPAVAALERETAPEGTPRAGQTAAGPYPIPIAFNVIPHCDAFSDGGYTKEEQKLLNETRKILGLPHLAVTATAVRVPVYVGHAESVLVELDRPLDVEEAREVLAAAPGVVVVDRPEDGGYPTPLAAAGRDQVFVGRLRRDPGSETGLWLWVVADNLRKGAATNAVQIAETMRAQGLLGAA